MIKTASVTETRQQLSAFLTWVSENRRDVVIQNRGKSEAVLIPYADYTLLQQAREQQRRQVALDGLRRLAQERAAGDGGISAEKADEIADQIVREAIGNLLQTA